MRCAYRYPLLAGFVLLCAAPGWSQIRQYQKNVAPGVVLYQTVDPQTPLVVSALKVNIEQPGVQVGTFVGRDHIRAQGGGKDRETVSSALTREGAIAGVNADFFPWTGDPLGLAIINGRLVSEPYPGRPALGVTSSGKIMIGVVRMSLTFDFGNGRILKANGVDRNPNQGELIVYNREWAPTTGAGPNSAELILKVDWSALTQTGSQQAQVVQVLPRGANSAIPPDGIVLVANGPRIQEMLTAGDGQTSATVKLLLQDDSGRSWLGVTNAVAGGSWLIHGTALHEDGIQCGFPSGFVNHRHPRTAAGVTKNGSLLLAVVDGRQASSRGATLPEMAQIMSNLGCTDAINMDGGGSSTMVAQGLVVNSPSDGQERAVADGLYVSEPAQTQIDPPQISVLPATARVAVGQSQTFTVQAPAGANLRDVLWGTKSGGGFVDQGGQFTGQSAGNRIVCARVGSSEAAATAEVTPGGAGSVRVEWDASTPASAPSRKLDITAVDAQGAPAAFAEVTVTVNGGVAAPPEVHCGAGGTGSTLITWDTSVPVANRFAEADCYGSTAKIAAQ